MKKRDILDEQALLETIETAGRPLRLDDILRIGGFSRKLKREVIAALHDLAGSGELVRLQGGGWAMTSAMKTRRGRLAVQRSGAAFVTPEGETARSGNDIYIAPEHVGEAWNGDTVDVMLLPQKRGSGKGPEGRVLAVVERGHSELVARVLREGSAEKTAVCRPVDPRLPFDVLADVAALDKAPQEFELLNIRMGEKLDDGGRRPLWAGTALASLGIENDAKVQEDLTKLNNLIPTAFPDNVVAEAEAVAVQPFEDADTLVDLRGEMLVTIDGADARDFDDAVFVSREGENWRLLVAIADVSYYVRPRTALDREARERGNSYYFPMSVEPMLPEVLCNGVCSLRPNEERRCMAADMTLDKDGNLLESRFVNGIMFSRARLTYNEVQAALEDAEGEAAAGIEERAPGVCAMLEQAAELADILMERRRRQGALDFDLPEAEFVVEEMNGASRVTGIRNRQRLFSHRLIEAFMVRANEAVAEFLTKKGAPFLYRVHPSPGPDRLEDLYRALRYCDADLPLPKAAKVAVPNWLTHVLDAAVDTDQAFVVSRLVLRSMMQARYSSEEDGHFGLASACYCHFTSPIRRYSDLVNHRALRYVLGLDAGGAIPAGHKLLETAEQCNGREKVATDAEREINRRMGCLLLQGHTGELFGGIISGVMNFGFFVELDNMPVEGMVRVETLGRDYYVYDEERQELRGEHSGESFRLGQRVTVKLTGVHVGRLEIDLEYQKDEEGRRPFRRKDDDRAPRRPRPEGKFGKRRDDREDGDRRTGRRAFADRKGFRPRFERQDDELARQRRYASESWGGDEDQREERKPRFEREGGFKKPFGSRFRKDGEEGHSFERRPFRRFESEDAENEGRSFRKDFRREGEEGREHGFKKPFGSRFHKEDGERRPFREHGFRPRFEKKPWDKENEMNEGEGFRKPRFQRDGEEGERSFRKPFGSRFNREEGEGRSFERRPFRKFDEEGGENEGQAFRKPRFEREDGERSFRPSRPRFDREGRDGEDRGFRKDFQRDGGERREHGFKKPFGSRFHKEEGEGRSFGKGRFDRDARGHGKPGREHDKKKFHGAPDDFFRIETENEKPVHRFGKRSK
ncbi:MAG: ribonuclease R [Mailhella sp.]|nr:ribonuclease R [Mailhella sp.]